MQRQVFLLLLERKNNQQSSELVTESELIVRVKTIKTILSDFLIQLFVQYITQNSKEQQNFNMLKNLKKQAKNKKQGKTKKDDGKKSKETKNANQVDDNDEEDACADLVDIDYSKKDQKKVKNIKKQQTYQLEEKDIEQNVVIPQIKKQEKVLTSWVPVSEQAALDFKNQFKLEEHVGEFESLTDQKLNQKTREELAKAPPKQDIKQTEEGMKTAKIEKTEQQLKMEKALQNDGFFLNTNLENIPFASSAIKQTNLNFINTKAKEQVKFNKVEKTAQQLKMEQLEKEQQQRMAKKKNNWLGSNTGTGNEKESQPGKQIVFRETPIVFASSAANKQGEIKFAPLNNNNQGAGMLIPLKNDSKSGAGMFAPLNQDKPKGSRRMDDDDGFVFVSKEEQKERRKKREEKQKEALKIVGLKE